MLMNTKTPIPLIPLKEQQQVVTWRNGRPLTRAALLFEAHQLAKDLPDRKYVLNDCSMRDAFLVAFLAALLRGQITVLPNDRSRHVARALLADCPGLYCLSDTDPTHELFETRQIILGRSATLTHQNVPTISADQTAAIAFTSGSTGDPQPNVKSVGILATTARLISNRFRLNQTTQTSILATVPSQHMYGLETSVALPLWAGVSVHAAKPLYPADVAAALSELSPPRVLVTTPIHLRALLEAGVETPQLHSVISATAPLSRDMAQQAEQTLKTMVFEIFGFTEAGTIATRRTTAREHWHTCDGVTVRQKDEVCIVQAPHLPAPVPMNDFVKFISPTEFILLGRISDNINIAGKRTSLSGLNNVLTSLPGVVDGTFYLSDQSDDNKIERLVAFIVAPNCSVERIRSVLQRSIDPTFMPRQIYLVPALPRSATGKLTRADLASMAKRFNMER
jgi:acyl-coenzyme A synthetase/AMP-(fatty) acid ligase